MAIGVVILMLAIAGVIVLVGLVGLVLLVVGIAKKRTALWVCGLVAMILAGIALLVGVAAVLYLGVQMPSHDDVSAMAGPLAVEAGPHERGGSIEVIALDLGNEATMELVRVPAGKFTMGSPANEKGRSDSEGPQREVTIGKAFYLGVYEVTQEQYEAVMGANPSKFKDPAKPVETVSWEEAMAFCKKLSQKTGRTVTLPTEAQWEYACRAGSKTRFCFGDEDRQLGEYARHGQRGDAGAAPVGRYKPNAWGLYDMHGNVWEWCSDWYAGSYANAQEKDPAGPAKGANRVLRGGSWVYNPQTCRSALRNGDLPGSRRSSRGFRVAVDLK